MSPSKFDISIKFSLDAWQCECGAEFAVVNVCRGVGAVGLWSDWGNPGHPPFCPHCGKRLAAQPEEKLAKPAGG